MVGYPSSEVIVVGPSWSDDVPVDLLYVWYLVYPYGLSGSRKLT